MPRKAVKTSYRKVKREDRPKPVAKAKARAKALNGASGRISPLSLYIMENSGSGMTRRELVEQFHEYDCKGKMKSGLGVKVCTGCDYWEPYRAPRKKTHAKND